MPKALSPSLTISGKKKLEEKNSIKKKKTPTFSEIYFYKFRHQRAETAGATHRDTALDQCALLRPLYSRLL